jgi:fructokinase
VRQQFPTGDDPERLMSEVVLWLSEQQRHLGRLAAVGVASFGPLDLCEGSKTWGCIATTPKRGWQRADLLGPLRRGFPGCASGTGYGCERCCIGRAAVGCSAVVWRIFCM